jgi:hypothetical protein
MGYKQHNNPFSRKISSPLKHNVTNAAGETWRHGHRKNGKTVSLESRNIAGSSDFGKRANRAVRDQETRTKRLSDERGGGRATEKNYAMDYANQIADMYNRGELVDGQFIADDFDKRKSKLSIKNNRLKIKPRFKSVGDAQRYNVQYADMQEGFDPEVGFQAAETQVTPEQIYEMMVQGGGMVSIVDGQIVAGNPNEVKYELSDEDYNKASLSGTNRYNTSIFDSNYVPEGFTSDERSDQPKKKLTVAELLERRRQKNNPINRVMSSSPLHSNHEEMDERSNQTFNLQEGYDYDEPVINVTEGEWVNDPNNPGQQMRVITTDESITGRRKNLNPGGLGQGQAENWGELKEEICSGKRKGNMSICDDVQSISNSVTEYRPIEVEEEEIPPPIIEEEPVVQPDRFNTSSGSLRGKGLDLPLPSVDLSQLIKTATGWFEPKSAGGGRGCGCMVNPR